MKLCSRYLLWKRRLTVRRRVVDAQVIDGSDRPASTGIADDRDNVHQDNESCEWLPRDLNKERGPSSRCPNPHALPLGSSPPTMTLIAGFSQWWRGCAVTHASSNKLHATCRVSLQCASTLGECVCDQLFVGRFGGDLDALLKVLATPHSGVSKGVSEGGEELCTLTREYPPELWLVDAVAEPYVRSGRVTRVGRPSWAALTFWTLSSQWRFR